MSGSQASDTMPKVGHVTDLREQWLVRADGALANRLQDREISSHLCENRCRNQQIREDFPVALSEQRDLEYEARLREHTRRRQAEIDAEIAREMAEINLRRQRRHQYRNNDFIQPAAASRAALPAPLPAPSRLPDDINPEELGLSPAELDEMKRRLEQEERDARLARELSNEDEGQDSLLADMRCAVEAQDGELARLLQEREYKKLQRAKEKAKQKAFLKKQQRLSQQQQNNSEAGTLCDAYSNPRDMIPDHHIRLCKSMDSDLNYVEPFEKEQIQSKSSALLAKQKSQQYYPVVSPGPSSSNINVSHVHSRSFEEEPSQVSANTTLQHRQPPPPPMCGKKPRFPDPVSIRPASHYPVDSNPAQEVTSARNIPHSYSENNNLYSCTFPPDHGSGTPQTSLGRDRLDTCKRLSVISDISAEGRAKRNSNREIQKKKKGCKIQ